MSNESENNCSINDNSGCVGSIEEEETKRFYKSTDDSNQTFSPSPPSSPLGDSNFEPTIDMMVNDFDDEQTLNEEESIAALEDNDTIDEIATLKEEGEMPLMELLAKYHCLPSEEFQGKRKKNSRKRKIQIHSNNDGKNKTVIKVGQYDGNMEEILKESKFNDYDVKHAQQRTHLLDLYPEEQNKTDIDLGVLYAADVEDIYGKECDNDELDDGFVKKTIMVGSSFQAVIPEGLSQYGDILPYENEDKLIWEPSQVSETEVEKYLLKASTNIPVLSENESTESVLYERKVNNNLLNSMKVKELNEANFSKTEKKSLSQKPVVDSDLPSVIKDSEQALHLLVLCGYDFKEALRRKRLNALPLTGLMSSWSEEECQKFEEGIQKYGKDFFKIRQNQVRTRSMRELVQFYYLWKKSERRDQNFANAYTVDHMELYLNESRDYNTSTVNSHSGINSYVHPFSAKKLSQTKQNPSIMSGNNTAAEKCTSQLNNCHNKMVNNDKKRDLNMSVVNINKQ